MAKVRVHELARDLNMTNKVLLTKLNDMDIAVKSHMSSLDDEVIEKIKASLFGTKKETIEETRIKPTVIRRRRKKAKVDAYEAQSEEAVLSEEAEAEKSVREPVADEKPTGKKAAKTGKKAAKPKKKAVKKEPSAKIIKLPLKPVEKPDKKKKALTKKAKAKVEKLSDRKKAIAAEPRPEAEPAKAELRKKKRKKKGEEPDIDKKFLKKKISFRRKAVIEGEDLYAQGYRPRKQRKMGKGKKIATGQKTQITVAKAIKRRIKIDEAIVLSDLAKRMGIKSSEIIKSMMAMGSMATVNQTIDFDTAVLLASEFDYEVERASFEEDTLLKQETDDPEKLAPRPPVVTIMGHVDHGKTSLLDVIRKSRISEMEAGGITQHIGAYHVATDKGQIAFLDTPGHEAFTAMRARGAQITDIVVLVVAADDGVMPQTIEAINHAKAAGVPIIVAINKIDKQNAEPEKVQRELAEIGLTPEDWGGETIYVNVSAKQAEGIDDLLEMILLQAEVLELKANPDKLAAGHVVEAKIDPGRGAVATILVREGTLRAGDPVVCGMHYGRIRAMLDDRSAPVESAGPSIPVEIVGLSGVPMAGDEFLALKDEKNAKQVSEHRQQKQRSKELAQSSRMSLDKLFERMQEGEVKDLNLIIKADVHGSIEALNDSLTKLSNDEVNVNVVHSASGTIAESDVSLATVSNAIVIGFNVRPSPKVQSMATDEKVDMRFYNVIYDVIKDMKSAMAGMMASTFEERILGSAEVREVFQIPKIGNIAGCYVTDGKIERGQKLRLLRDGVVVYTGKNSSLRRFKDDVKEVQTGYECGIGIENYNDIKVGDAIECYYLEEIRPELD
jgi:translation initiation factor IF-2